MNLLDKEIDKIDKISACILSCKTPIQLDNAIGMITRYIDYNKPKNDVINGLIDELLRLSMRKREEIS